MYLNCYNRCLLVSLHTKHNYTYGLSKDHIDTVANSFFCRNIPFKLQAEDSDFVIEGDPEEPANSRVIFSLDGNEYVISNCGCFIKEKYSEGIKQALIKKGIPARVELIGQYANVRPVKYKQMMIGG